MSDLIGFLCLGLRNLIHLTIPFLLIVRIIGVLMDPLRIPLDVSGHLQRTTSNLGGANSNIMKVNQVDAHVLDMELLDLLRIQLGGILAPPFFPAGFMDSYKPELNALLDFLLFRFTIFCNQPTPGMRMQNLKFVDAVSGPTGVARVTPPRPSQRLLLGLLYICGKWLFARSRRYVLVTEWSESEPGPGHTSHGRNWRKIAAQTLDRAESIFRLGWLINFIVFLKYGRYPSLLQRLAGMRLVYEDPLFMNRQLLWNNFTQLALCVIPLVDWDALRRQVTGLIQQRRLGNAMGEEGTLQEEGHKSCLICGEEEAQTPYVTDCGHIFCYYCLKTACLQDDQYACPRCGAFFATSKRWTSSAR